jgi:hypothetical protein
MARSVWYGLLWGILGLATAVFWLGSPILLAAWVLGIYRVVKGWLRFNDNQPMYVKRGIAPPRFWDARRCQKMPEDGKNLANQAALGCMVGLREFLVMLFRPVPLITLANLFDLFLIWVAPFILWRLVPTKKQPYSR